jgi:hypothetical protein
MAFLNITAPDRSCSLSGSLASSNRFFDAVSRAVRILVAVTVVLGFAAATAMGQQESVSLRTVGDEEYKGQLVNFDIDSVALLVGGAEQRLDLEQVAEIDFGNPVVPAETNRILITLVDQSTFFTDSVEIKNRVLSAETGAGVLVTAATRDVAFVQYQNYKNQIELARQWRDILSDDTRGEDAIVVNKNNELATVEGIIGDLADEKLGFSIGEQTARVPLKKIEALIFYHASGRELARPVCRINLVDESVIQARRVVINNEQLVVTVVSGSEIAIPFSNISSMSFALGREVFLSSLTPSTNDWQPLVTSSAIFEQLRKIKLARVNESFSGKPLSLRFFEKGGSVGRLKQFENGFAMNAGGKLAFNLNGQYETLSGWVGFNPDANPSGHLRFKVWLDGKVVLEKELIHRTMGDPIQLDLDVKKADRVVFSIDYFDGRSTGDQLHLVELKVSQ